MDTLRERARQVRLLVLDVDGVLTDGRIYMSATGEELKVFDVRDGYGLVAAQRAGVAVAIISGRDSPAVACRAAELGIGLIRQGVADKAAVLGEIQRQLGLGASETACVGDDVPDLPMLSMSTLAVAVADAHPSVRTEAHWVTEAAGGRGAVREVCDLLLSSRIP
jgi:3-deoxy-D-manno-octulosonate 8-phosphate phosphatase (KDO 8-P phosphatase)